MSIFLQTFLHSCFDGGTPFQLGDTHKTKLSTSIWREAETMSAVSFPASTVKSSTIELFTKLGQQLLNLSAWKIGSTYSHMHLHTCGHTGMPQREMCCHQKQKQTAGTMLQFGPLPLLGCQNKRLHLTNKLPPLHSFPWVISLC